MKSHLVESPLHNEHQTLFDVIIIDGVIDERITNTEIFKIGESLVGEAKHILKSLGKHNFCYGNSSAWGSNELHDTNTIFNAYGNRFHLNRSLFEETLVKTAESNHNQFITIIRDSVTKSLLVEMVMERNIGRFLFRIMSYHSTETFSSVQVISYILNP
ncbi:hypothetical protein RclHR1_15730003 [Rhizophagus clarus]|uniref:Uncharacterized protein n=1 Tax=Rhizophagus clarus TaxID=94130 RepID=A0A2Z6QFU5_9GLOM|nr:hypothetical protein RclHR1_15730003 [Rhizophagus clarus]